MTPPSPTQCRPKPNHVTTWSRASLALHESADVVGEFLERALVGVRHVTTLVVRDAHARCRPPRLRDQVLGRTGRGLHVVDAGADDEAEVWILVEDFGDRRRVREID